MSVTFLTWAYRTFSNICSRPFFFLKFHDKLPPLIDERKFSLSKTSYQPVQWSNKKSQRWTWILINIIYSIIYLPKNHDNHDVSLCLTLQDSDSLFSHNQQSSIEFNVFMIHFDFDFSPVALLLLSFSPANWRQRQNHLFDEWIHQSIIDQLRNRHNHNHLLTSNWSRAVSVIRSFFHFTHFPSWLFLT